VTGLFSRRIPQRQPRIGKVDVARLYPRVLQGEIIITRPSPILRHFHSPSLRCAPGSTARVAGERTNFCGDFTSACLCGKPKKCYFAVALGRNFIRPLRGSGRVRGRFSHGPRSKTSGQVAPWATIFRPLPGLAEHHSQLDHPLTPPESGGE
jgi:hypothetical protein